MTLLFVSTEARKKNFIRMFLSIFIREQHKDLIKQRKKFSPKHSNRPVIQADKWCFPYSWDTNVVVVHGIFIFFFSLNVFLTINFLKDVNTPGSNSELAPCFSFSVFIVLRRHQFYQVKKYLGTFGRSLFYYGVN